MARRGYYDEQYGFVPYDDCPQDNLYSESEAKHTFSPSEPKTNADRIRAMTDEELANRIVCHVSCSCCPLEQKDCKKHCYELWLEWLRKEAE